MCDMDLNIRGVEEQAVRRFKARAADEGQTLKEWAVKILMEACDVRNVGSEQERGFGSHTAAESENVVREPQELPKECDGAERDIKQQGGTGLPMQGTWEPKEPEVPASGRAEKLARLTAMVRGIEQGTITKEPEPLAAARNTEECPECVKPMTWNRQLRRDVCTECGHQGRIQR